VNYAIPNPVESAAIAAPDRTALVDGGVHLSWAALRDRVVARAAELSAGWSPGDPVTITGAPTIDWVVTLHAAGWMGAAALLVPPGQSVDGVQGLASSSRTSAVSWRPGEEPQFWALDSVRALVLTSGTTGEPSAVALTTAQIVFSAFGSATRLGLLPADRWLCPLPLHHVGGLMTLYRAAFQGTCVELMSVFSPNAVVSRLASGEVSHVSLVPTMLDRVIEAGAVAQWPESLRAVLVGGAAMSPELSARAEAAGLPVAATWGMSEAASQICTSWPGDQSRTPPLPFARVQATDDGGLLVRGPVVRGELVTADLGRVDASGAVVVTGRSDEMIISGGVNISPAEIESVLREHPDVLDAAVVGIDDSEWGSRPAAALVGTLTGPRPGLKEMRAFCRSRLQGFQLPDRVVWCDALPRGDLGKISRVAVRNMVEEAR
jgi:O-succinylbenzoic acid--CoA ligase